MSHHSRRIFQVADVKDMLQAKQLQVCGVDLLSTTKCDFAKRSPGHGGWNSDWTSSFHQRKCELWKFVRAHKTYSPNSTTKRVLKKFTQWNKFPLQTVCDVLPQPTQALSKYLYSYHVKYDPHQYDRWVDTEYCVYYITKPAQKRTPSGHDERADKNKYFAGWDTYQSDLWVKTKITPKEFICSNHIQKSVQHVVSRSEDGGKQAENLVIWDSPVHSMFLCRAPFAW